MLGSVVCLSWCSCAESSPLIKKRRNCSSEKHAHKQAQGNLCWATSSPGFDTSVLRADIGWLLWGFFFVFAHLNSMLIPSRRFSQQPGCRRTLVPACISVCQPRRSTQHFSSVRQWVETTGLLCLTEKHLLQIWGDIFFPWLCCSGNSRADEHYHTSASREHVPTCLKWPPLAHLCQTGLLYQTCSFFLGIVASQSTDFAFVSCRVHWVPTV